MAASIEVMSVASAAPVREESKEAGSVSSPSMAVTTAAAVPLMSVREEPSRVPSPLTAAMELMSAASAAPAARVLSKEAGSVSRSARAVTTAAAAPLMAVRLDPSRVPSPLFAATKEISAASSAPAVSVESKVAGSVSRSLRA